MKSIADSGAMCALVLGVASACGPGVQQADALCRQAACNTPPPDECIAPAVLRRYGASGTCDIERGSCSYPHSESQCEHGCFDAARCRRAGDVLWQGQDALAGVVAGLALADDGTLYLTATERSAAAPTLHALAPDGVLRWSVDVVPQPVAVTAPVVATTGTVYVGSTAWNSPGREVLHARGADSTVIWELAPALEAAPVAVAALGVAADGTVYAVTQEDSGGVLQAIASDKRALWSFPFAVSLGAWEGFAAGHPVIDRGGAVYFATNNGIFSVERGSERWHYPWSRDPLSPSGVLALAERSAAAGGGPVLLVQRSRMVLAFDGDRGGEPLWSIGVTTENQEDLLYAIGPPVVDEDGHVVLVGERAHEIAVYGLDLVSGEERWCSMPAQLEPTGTIVLAENGVIYVSAVSPPGTDQHALAAINRAGELLWVTPTVGAVSSIAIAADGTVYALVARSGVWAFVGGEQTMSSSGWPRARGDGRNSGQQRSTSEH